MTRKNKKHEISAGEEECIAQVSHHLQLIYKCENLLANLHPRTDELWHAKYRNKSHSQVEGYALIFLCLSCISYATKKQREKQKLHLLFLFSGRLVVAQFSCSVSVNQMCEIYAMRFKGRMQARWNVRKIAFFIFVEGRFFFYLQA